MSDEAKDPLIGQTLGAYLLVEPLGRGGMATVFKAHEAALDRYVAVKILPQSLASSEDFIQRFRREAKAIAQLNHPNIVPIYSYGEEQNIIYIAMQLVEGGALKREEGQIFAAEDALKLLAPIARALDYAHQHGYWRQHGYTEVYVAGARQGHKR
ncbi:serine/threonine protein kinase [bacterium]|nr:serine/threonine protein kinase [bacterium]